MALRGLRGLARLLSGGVALLDAQCTFLFNLWL
jgi:hypothetical protein